MKKTTRYLAVCVIALGLATSSALAIDAKTLLVGMAEKIAGAERFSVTIHMGFDAVQPSGQKIEFNEIRRVLVSRPDNLRVDVQRSDGDESSLIFDGRTLTLFNTAHNVYAQTSKPGSVDDVIRFAVGKLGMRVPLARMLITTFPEDIQRLSENIDYVERNTLGKAPTDHITGQTEEVDYQVWITDDMLPRKIVLTYKNEPGQPQFWALFHGWDMSPRIKSGTFKFTPPDGAEKIPTLLPITEREAMDNTQGGAQ